MSESQFEQLYTSIREGGVERIQSFVTERTKESYFLDFKLTEHDDYQGRRSLYDSDAKNFAKALSAFGNSEGGVLVWGIKTEKNGGDYASETKEITGVSVLSTLLDSFTGTLTTPGHNGVENHVVFSDQTNDKGFVVSKIARSNRRPLQSIWGGENKYYIRAGSSSVAAPHSVIAGMFGASPQSDISMVFISSGPKIEDGFINIKVGVVLRNQGENVAEKINGYMEISGPGSPTESGIELVNTTSFDFHKNTISGIKIAFISKENFRIGIEQEVLPITMQFRLKPSFNEGMRIEGLVHSHGQVPHRIKRIYTAGELEEAYNSFMADQGYDLLGKLFNFSDYGS